MRGTANQQFGGLSAKTTIAQHFQAAAPAPEIEKPKAEKKAQKPKEKK